MKKPIALLALGAALAALAVVPSPPPTGRLRLGWSYPVAELSTNLTFIVSHSTNLSLALTNWPTLTNVIGTNVDVTVQVTPGFHAFVVQASNFHGISPFSNVASTPPLPRSDVNLTIERAD